MPTPSSFAKKLAAVAQAQHTRFQFVNEADPLLCKQIKKWTQDIGFSFTSCTTVPWSAVFISWCVMNAGRRKPSLNSPCPTLYSLTRRSRMR